MSPINYKDVLDKDISEVIYSKFESFMQQPPKENRYFEIECEEILERELAKNTIIRANNLEVFGNKKDFAQFMAANAMAVTPVKMLEKGHNFSQLEKVYVYGYWMFLKEANDLDYPYDHPMKQILEIYNFGPSDEFIDFAFSSAIIDLKISHDMLLEEIKYA